MESVLSGIKQLVSSGTTVVYEKVLIPHVIIPITHYL